MHSERSVNTTDIQECSMAATLVTYDLKSPGRGMRISWSS